MYELFEQLCREKGVTAYRVCHATGISTATITSWKQGKYQPKQDKLQLIADYFGVPLDYFTGHTDKPVQVAFQVSDLERELVIAFRKADKVTKANILKLLDVKAEDAESKIS